MQADVVQCPVFSNARFSNPLMVRKTLSTRRFIKPSYAYLIEKKRDGQEFSKEEIRYIIDSILDGEMPDFQMAALAMAIFFQGMSAQETAILTEEMMLSGEVIDLSHIAKPKIDKYSTGGVGDKTSLVLVPLAVASGIVLPMMGSVDQDFAVSALDKLSAVPGFNPVMEIDAFIEQLEKVGGAMVRQGEELAGHVAIELVLAHVKGFNFSQVVDSGIQRSRKLVSGQSQVLQTWRH